MFNPLRGWSFVLLFPPASPGVIHIKPLPGFSSLTKVDFSNERNGVINGVTTLERSNEGIYDRNGVINGVTTLERSNEGIWCN